MLVSRIHMVLSCVFVTLLPFIGACQAAAETQADTAPPRVVTDIAPVHSLVAKVLGDVAEPQFLVRPGASPHGYAMRPSEARALAEADLLVWIGPALEPWLKKAADSLGGDVKQLVLMDAEGTLALDARDVAVFAQSGADEHDKHEHEHEHEGHHDHGAIDPHMWLDPVNASHWLNLIAQNLSALDPSRADIYQANASKAQGKLDNLTKDLQEQLAPLKGLRYLVYHDAYQYFGARFDLPAFAAIQSRDAEKPGIGRLSDLRKALADQRIGCVVSEPQFDTRLIDTLAVSDIPMVELDPLGVTLEPGAGLYDQLIIALASAFESCNFPN